MGDEFSVFWAQSYSAIAEKLDNRIPPEASFRHLVGIKKAPVGALSI